jgi:quercetin dioxygenase-like cupin family protein
MPIKGQTISNPTNGDTYEFLETAADTNGESLKMLATIHSKGQLVPRHFHVYQDETFEILDGELTVEFGGKTTVYQAGEKVTLPKNEAHNHYNNSNAAVRYVHTVSPALDFELLIENLVGLAADGKSKNGKYGLVQELVALRYLDSKSYLADVPVVVQKTMMHTIAPVARLFGYRAVYKKYSGIEK